MVVILYILLSCTFIITMVVHLRRLGSSSRIKVLRLPQENKIWLAGRGTNCQIYTKSQYASRLHFAITYRDQKYFISDLKSVNGTFVNDEKITSEKLLTFGSIISVGVPSDMQNSPDCIVFIFESHSVVDPPEEQSTLNENEVILEETLPCLIKPMDVDLPTKYNTPNTEKNKNTLRSLNSSPPIEIITIEPSVEVKPPKIRKLNDVKAENANDDENDFAYEALTQVDEQVQTKPDLNYSLTEELIEISDSEDDLSPELSEGNNKSPEPDEDDDVVVLESVNNENNWTISDEPTETDKKWMMRLLKPKKEEEYIEIEDETKDNEEAAVEKQQDSILFCRVQLTRLSTKEAEELKLQSKAETIPRVEPPESVTKRTAARSVSFNLVPEVKYFETPVESKTKALEKGKMRFTRIIFYICNWNTHWLEECKNVAPDKDPPDICEEKLRKMPRRFLCHSDYMAAFIPAILLQLWHKVKTKWINSGCSGFRQTVSCDSYHDFPAENLQVFACTGLAQNVNAHKQLLREGHLVLLRLHQTQTPNTTTPASEKYSKKLGYLVFGFVETRIYERFYSQRLHPSLAERCGSIVGDLHIVKLNVIVKKRPDFLVDKNKLIQLTVVHHISQEIKMLKGICFLPDSPLFKAVLKPPQNELPAVEFTDEDDLVFKGPLDKCQREIIKKLSYGISTTESLLFSVHGSAGSGKGQIIMGLILQFLYGEEWKENRPKILYCTQWSIPLDEMVVRFKNYRQNLGKAFNLVRVGPVREAKPEVREFCLSNLAAGRKNSDKVNYADGRKGYIYTDAEVEVIKNADVICATCASSGMTKMCTAFEKILTKDRKQKIVCIIDEAMSCKEPDSVIPLLLGVTHLLLFGDIYQLEPTPSFEKIHSLGFDNSLFMRIYKNYENVSPDTSRPIFVLNAQFRMSPNLYNFTKEIVYNTGAGLPELGSNVSTEMGNIKCCLLLVDQTPKNLARDEKDNREVEIVSQLVKAVTKITKTGTRNPFKFAVITCDSKQTEALRHLLPKRQLPEVEIDMIQAFQGREFDAVVFAYDGRNITTSWLITALTRARFSLFIFSSERSINGSSFFSKTAEIARSCKFLKYVHPDTTSKDWENILTKD